MDADFKSGIDVIYLTSCALHGIMPDKAIVEAMDLKAVYKQAKRHKMLSITCMALETYWDDLEAELINIWRVSIDLAIKSSFLYSVEREKLFRFMEDNEIAYLPLKGIILQDIYPRLGMRQMVDNDILIDINKRDLVRKYMEENGYTTEGYGKDMHDVYTKAPIFSFEMHVYLCIESVNPVFYNYYLNIWERLEKQQGFGRRFSAEDFYIHMLVHTYKHFYYTGGVGLKPLTDIFVYIWKYKDSLDKDYLNAELEKLQLTVFEKNIRELAQKIFNPDAAKKYSIAEDLNEEERELLKYFIDSGCFGRKDVLYQTMIDRFAKGDGSITFGSKVRYFLFRAFPTGAYVRENYPFFYKYKVLMPVMWIYRFFSKVFVMSDHLKKEMKFLGKQK